MIHKIIYYFHVSVYSEVLTHFSPLWQEWIGMCKYVKKQLKELQHREVKQTNQNKASQVLLHITISPKGQFLALLKSRPLRVHLWHFQTTESIENPEQSHENSVSWVINYCVTLARICHSDWQWEKLGTNTDSLSTDNVFTETKEESLKLWGES